MTTKEALEQLCRGINGQKPILVPLDPRPWAKLKRCFDNVDLMIEKYGGRRCLGWLFQHRSFGNEPGVFLGVHHAVWEHEGNLLDPTPPCENTMLNGKNMIYFLVDRSATQLRPAGSTTEIPRPNRVYSPSRNPGVQKLVTALRRQEMSDHVKRVEFARIASAARKALGGD